MLAALILFAVAGFVMGLVARWPLLAAAAVLALCVVPALLLASGREASAVVVATLACLVVLEIAYLAGSLCRHRGVPSRLLRPRPVAAQPDTKLADARRRTN